VTARPAGFWRRAFAWLLDMLLLAFVVGLAVLVLRWGFREWLSHQVLDPAGLRWARWSASRDRLQALLLLAIPFLYFALLEMLPLQATPGKLLLGCRVRRPDGTRAGFVRILVRTLAKPLSLLPCGLGVLLAAVGGKRAAHDYLSGSTVLRRS
jgi:uncharacterized RDD family membrane protein YckC